MIRWTQRARTDLRAIHDHIARESPGTAKVVVREIHGRAASLLAAPRMGRIVPELREPELREISAYSWRILYRLREGDLFVVAIVHKRRSLEPAGEFKPG